MEELFRVVFGRPIERNFRKQLAIDQSGRCELTLESNVEIPETPVIGRFETRIDAAEAAWFHNQALRLTQRKAELGPLLPGATLVHISVEEARVRRGECLVDPAHPPAEFVNLEQRLASIEAAARRAPVSGVRLEFALRESTIPRNRPVSIAVRITAVGSSRLAIIHPLYPPNGTSGRLVLSGIRSDIPQSQLQFHHRQASELEPTVPQKSVWGPVYIGPNEPLVSVSEAVLDWPPGPYRVRLIMETSGKLPQVDLVLGCITTAAQQLVVAGASRKDDEDGGEAGGAGYEPPDDLD